MMAGKIRMRTFFLGLGVTLLACAGVGVAGAGFGLFQVFDVDHEGPIVAPVVAAPIVPAPVAAPVAPVAPTTAPAARAADNVVLSYLGKRSVSGGKLKDASTGSAYKINIYQDEGQASANRAKLDLDRDEKWDEKFTWKNGTVERQVAPADDEAYTETYRWDGAAWVR